MTSMMRIRTASAAPPKSRPGARPASQACTRCSAENAPTASDTRAPQIKRDKTSRPSSIGAEEVAGLERRAQALPEAGLDRILKRQDRRRKREHARSPGRRSSAASAVRLRRNCRQKGRRRRRTAAAACCSAPVRTVRGCDRALVRRVRPLGNRHALRSVRGYGAHASRIRGSR